MTAKRRFLGYGRQRIDDDDIAAVIAVLKGDYLTQGPIVPEFEAQLARATGAKYAVAVSNGTAALHLAVLASGLKADGLGITQALTFAASANAIRYAGANLGLTDIDGGLLAMTASALKATIERSGTPDVVIPVHMAGLATDIASLKAEAPNAIFIEDAAHALGASYPDGKPVGSCPHSAMTVFSFHPVKPITTAEGGAITTNDEALYRKLLRLRNHGIERDDQHWQHDADGPWYYEQQDLGFNYRLSDFQAALGISQIAKLDRFIDRRRVLARFYDEAFQGSNLITPLQASSDERAVSGHHIYPVMIDFTAAGKSRPHVMAVLHDKGIGSQLHYIPVYRHPYYRDFLGIGPSEWPRLFPETEAYYQKALTIPLHADLSDDEAAYVAQSLKQALS